MDETNSSSIVIRRLCALFGDLDDKSISVMPFRGGAADGETEMWIIPSGGVKTSEYVPGMRNYCDIYKLMLRYTAVCPSDRLYAAELLERVIDHGISGASEYGLRITKNGSVRLESENSEAIYSLEFTVKYTVQTAVSPFVYYISFPGQLKKALGEGLTRFKENLNGELFTRRHIHESFMRSDIVRENCSFDFDFDTLCDGCALLPVIYGEKNAVIYKVFSDGNAWMTECILSDIKLSNGSCSGTFTSCGKVVTGSFDKNTMTFTEDREIRTGEVIT